MAFTVIPRFGTVIFPNDAAGLRLMLRTAQLLPPFKGPSTLGSGPAPFPDQTASLLPGSVATTRTGLSPAGDDELLIRS